MKRIILSLCAIAFIFSCSNDDDGNCETGGTQASNFYALTVGNSWVYKNYIYNTSTEEYDYSGVIDSVEVVGTQEANGNTYFEFKTLTSGNDDNNPLLNVNGERTELLRDSLGYLVWETGAIKFTNNDFSERLLNEQDWGNTYETLQQGTSEFIVEAGNFTSINSHRYAKSNPDGTLLPGLDNIYYSDGVGFVYETISFVSSNIPRIQRRLDSYSVQ